jgi:gliding motility-associated-like protein
MMLRRYITIVCLFFSIQSFATHIVGGEIFYDCLGGNRYYVTLKQYLDCCPSCTSQDEIAAIGVFDAQGLLVQSLYFPLLKINSVPPTMYAECFTIPSDMCVNEIVYGDTVDLPPIPGGYSISYQRCCRNADIVNITNAHQEGSTYQTFVNPSITNCNNSSRYKELPPLLLCVDVPFVFDNSVSDPDHDSIYYELCSPFEGADPMSPMPDVPSNPPYNYVRYNNPYSGSYPIASAPAFKIDPRTGIITGTPTMIGRFVVGVCAYEYRNGILLNTNKRDYQFNVTNCPKSAKANIPNQTAFCSGLTMRFSQFSINASTFHWNFGDPTTLADTSNLVSPSWTYPAVGTYNITLIINKFTKCSDTAYATVKVQDLLNPYFFPPNPKCMNEPNEGLMAWGTFSNTATFQWNFGLKATPSTANTKDPGKVVFSAGGIYPVMLTVTDNGCKKSFVDTIKVLEKPVANYETESPVACELLPVHFINRSKGPKPLLYSWMFGDDQISMDESPYHTYKKSGTYPAQLFVTAGNGCKDTFKLPASVEVIKLPTAGFDLNPKDTSVFYSQIHVDDFSKDKTGCSMFWGDGSVSGDCSVGHTYTTPGTYQVIQIVENQGCFDTAYASVIVRPEFVFWLPNAFTPGSSEGTNDVFRPTLYGVHDYRFLIFDRWGEQLFQTSNPQEGWSGYRNNHLCQQDVYVYKIIFRDDVTLKTHQYIGHFTLLR